MISVGLRILTICELLKQVSIEAFEEEYTLCLFFRSFQNEPILRDRFHTLNITIFQVYSVIHLRHKTFLPTVQFHKFPIPIFSIVIMIIIVINAHTSYLSFFLHWQNIWKIKFTPKNANFSR